MKEKRKCISAAQPEQPGKPAGARRGAASGPAQRAGALRRVKAVAIFEGGGGPGCARRTGTGGPAAVGSRAAAATRSQLFPQSPVQWEQHVRGRPRGSLRGGAAGECAGSGQRGPDGAESRPAGRPAAAAYEGARRARTSSRRRVFPESLTNPGLGPYAWNRSCSVSFTLFRKFCIFSLEG